MASIFLFCALIGGTVLVCQFILTLVGLGDAGFELADDIPDSADTDFADDVPDVDGSTGHGELSTWLFGVISFRTLVAAATFFGLAGMASLKAGLSLPAQLLIAVACGVAAMYGVHWLMLSFFRLGQTGTMKIESAIGKTATVYIPIPEAGGGQGKVQVEIQDRLDEFAAVTSSGTRLNTGAKVVVVAVVGGTTLEVEPLTEPVEAAQEMAT